ncbi:molybdopterin-synthase adenylyltransferase MoeB [Saccharobesus litoralis]|uniref:Molybdopterin-synthase adenylyltransferase MoeB n=1 Tax=Saccharobesus litoralis TaxID=2172099 RepID=A0A2S0VM97_9ALTE|nr:HesA/MoeB/ThiF family protein [Saccharobesus litoralis]AWB65341.1 molybdopterin-synthase adenylyltransferase MoeB [Saccharobesus litoralis]
MSLNLSLNNKEQVRYSRHLLLSKIGESGQLAFKNARILIVGVGGLGCSAAQYLAASGVGHITLIDHDHIELSNLQRQVLYKTNHLKASKVQTARNQLLAANPEIQVEAIEKSILDVDLAAQLQATDIVLDCTDNAQTRSVINQACFTAGVKLVSASGINGQGQLVSFDFAKENSPCYACLFPEAMDTGLNCSNAGVISPLLGIMGSLQATECLRLILGMTENLARLTLVDVWQMDFKQFKLVKNKNCPCCQAT